LMSGTPVIATDAGGPREIIAEATLGSGRLVPVGNHEALATAVLAALDELPATTAAARAARPSLRAPEPERFAAIFRAVVDSDTRKKRRALR
jgi:glycosyltransferase involved in cell wall biosynthesis